MGRTGLALVGKATLSKSLIQFSADGWDCEPSLLVVWPEVAQSWSLQSYGKAIGWAEHQQVTNFLISLSLVPHRSALLQPDLYQGHNLREEH